MKDRVVGLITANYDTPELVSLTGDRTVASLPYAGRYRLIDFSLSNMVNSGIGTVGLITPYKYRSIIDHIGAGSEWGLDRKNGGLFILPGSVFGITSPGSRFLLRDIRRNLVFLTRSPAPYVVITSSNTVVNMDMNPLIEQHIKSGADITMAYVTADEDDKDVYAIKTEGERVTGTGRGVKAGDKAFIDCFILSHDLLFKILEWYAAIDYLDFFEVLEGEYAKMDVRTFCYEGYAKSIFSVPNYFKRSMDLLSHEVENQIFDPKRPIITKIVDTPPAKYAKGARV
ncbi:MAG: sugar phosphate nucleotidyltransferase, partial [bacterium]